MEKIFAFFFDKSLLIFLVIGLGNTVISTLGSQALLGPMTKWWGKDVAYWASTGIMFSVCSIASFFLNRKFSFESQAPLLQSAFRFTVVIAVCYAISFGISKILVPKCMERLFPKVPETWVTRVAMLVAQVIFTGLNYIGQRLWAFAI